MTDNFAHPLIHANNNSPPDHSYLRSFKCWLRSFAKNKATSLEDSVVELIEEHDEHGSKIGSEERELLHNMLNFGDLSVDDIMVPRNDIIAVSDEVTLEALQQLFIQEAHTRMPVYQDSLDNIIGFIHVKDLLKALQNTCAPFVITAMLRTALTVSSSTKLIDLLAKMRDESVHMALVIDEYGGVDGLVTIEDLIACIIGETKGEHDGDTEKSYNVVNKDTIEVSGRMTIVELEKLLQLQIIEGKSEDFDTVGGFILSIVGYLPSKGEVVAHGPAGIDFEVLDVDPRRVKTLLIHKLDHGLE
jgi:CBS domain containing-hemolysin-like protein